MLDRNTVPASTAAPATWTGSLLRRTTLLVAALLLMGATSWAQLTGTLTVPTNYATLELAIADLNTQGVGAGGVTIEVEAANPQTAPVGGYSITATGTVANPIVINGNGNTVTAFTPQATGNTHDAIFEIIGGDWITIENFVMQENVSNTITALGSNNMTEWGVALHYASVTNGAQNCTIRNNTISLNRLYPASWGIYSNSTHAATSPGTTATASSADGANSGLVIQGNAISNVNNGIAVVGPTVAANHNTTLTIGGATAPLGNTLTNFGTTGTFGSYVNVSGTVNGILVRNTREYTIRNNSLTSSAGGNTTNATLRGIFIVGFSNAPTGTLTQTISNNTISLQGGNATGQVLGIVVESLTGNATTTLGIDNNNFTTLGHTVAATATVTAISSVMANLNLSVSSNTFTNLAPNTTGSFTFITASYTMPANGSQTVSSNSIVTGFNKSGVGGSVAIFVQNGGSPGTATFTGNNNNFSNITVAGSTTIGGFSNTDGGTPTKTVTGNTFSNWVGGTGAITGLTVSFSGSATVSNNTVSNISSAGAITGIATSSGTETFVGNTVHTLASTGASAVTGMAVTGGTTKNLRRNQIYNLEANNASGTVNGILVSSGTTVNLINNIVGDLRAPLANAANPVVGINLTGGTTLTASYNTVYLAATSAGALFGSSALSASTSPNVTLRNNILVNNSTPNGATGFASAYRRSSTTLTSYNAASNNNLLYAGTPGANNLIFFDGTNSNQTLAAFKASMITRDQSSVTENPTFASTVSGNANFLRFAAATSTQAESGGIAIAGIDDDIAGDIRQGSVGYAGTGTAPDIGADEFEGAALDLVGPSIVFTPLGNTCDTGNRTLTATITDASGVPTSGSGLPVLYWRINAGSYTAATATHAGGNLYDFSFGSGVAATDTVRYYIVAQDLAGTPNLSASPGAGATGLTADPPAAATPPTTPTSYAILNTLSGNYNVGAAEVAPNFTTLTAAIAAYNTQCVSGAVTFTLVDAAYNTGETFPITINQNVAASPTNTLTIRPAGTTTISGSNTGALIRFNGADYVTIDGSSAAVPNTVCPPATSSRDLTINNTSTGSSSAVVWLQTATGNNGATNNTVRNCVLTGNSNTTTLFGIGSGSPTIGTSSLGTGNNNNRIENNVISRTQNGIYTQGASAANKNTGNVITQNVMNAVSPDNVQIAGIRVGFEDGITISGNTIANLASSSNLAAISLGSIVGNNWTTTAGNEVTGATVSNNIIDNVVRSGDGSAYGIIVAEVTSPGAAANLIQNNVISQIRTGGTPSDSPYGIRLGGGSTSTTLVYHNNIYMTGVGASSSPTFGIAINGADPVVDLRNNVVVNLSTSSSANRSAIALSYSTYSNLTSNNNVFWTNGTGIGAVGAWNSATLDFATWQSTTGQDANSLNLLPGFVSVSNARTDGNNASSVGLDGAGVTVNAAPDIDCAVRGTPPDIGANEFTAATCFTPSGFGVSGITFEQATLNWTAVVGETYNWEIRTSGVGGDPSPAFSGTAASGPVTVPGLDDVTNYTAYIQTVCPGPETSVWSNGTPFSTPLAPIATFPWIEDFEADNGGFAIVNGSQTNKWFHGLANNDVGTPLGGNALYVSNDNGLNNTYTIASATSTVHVWRDLDLSTPGEYSLQFNYRTVGESIFDYIRVWLAPTSYSPAAGTQTTVSVPGAVRLGGNFNLTDPVIYNNSGVLTIPAAFVGTTARLIFEWRNDGSGGSQPPGSIDSVRVNINPCSAPTNLALSNLFGTSATATWVNGTATVQDYELRTSGAAGSGAAGLELSGTSNTQSLVLTPLLPSTTYTFHIRGNCAPDSSSWISGSFTTPCATGTMPLAEGFNAASTIPACWGQFGVVGTSAATFPTSGTSPTVSPFEGTRFVRWTSFTAGNETRLVAPPLSTVGSANVDVSFAWFENNNASFSAGAFLNEGATLEYSTDGITFTAIQFFARHNGALTVGTGAWAQKLVTVPAGAVGQSTVFFAWRFRSENGNAMALDKVGINTTPVCPVYTVDLVEPIDCSGSTFSIEIDITDLGTDPEVDVVYKVFGTPGDPDTLSVTATGVVTIGPFDRWDLVTVSLLGDNLGPCALDLGRFFSTCPIVIDCDDTTPLTVRHCYTANDPRTFTFVTNDPTRTLDVTFLSGSAIDAADQVDFRAGLPSGGSFSSTPLGTTDLGTLGPLGSTTDSLSLVLLTPSGNSCAAGSPGLGAGWAFTVRCSGCIQPFVQDIIPVPDCSNGTFTLPVEFSYLGFNFATQADADSAGIRYVVNGNAAGADTIWVQNPGVDPFPVDILGPYAFGTTVDITLLHEEGTACDNVLAPITLGYFPNCSNDVVCDAFLTPVNPNFTCTQLRPGQFAGATLTTGVPAATTCGGTLTADVWYRFVATQPSQRIQLQDINTGATNMRTSLYGGDCDGTLTQIGTCVTGTTQLNATGLVPATTYWVRVATVTASSTQTFNICISEPPTLDMQVVTPLVTPLTNGCYTASEPVTVTLRNNTQHTPIDFSVNPVTVTVTLTGASTTVLSTVVNTGTLAASTTQNVVVGNLNMSAAGTYTFAATASVVGDQVPGNNGFTGQTRTVVAPQPIANVALNFDETPGFSGTNLATITSSRWREATGATVPGVGTTSAWNSSATAQNTQLGTGISARIQFTTFTSRNEWLLGPKFVPQVGSVLKYKVAITGNAVGTAATGSGMQAAGAANDRVVVRISTNCGVSYQDLFSHNPSTTVGLTNVWDPRSIDLSAYNGQEVIIAFWANATSVSTHPNYNFLIDDILVLNEPVCAGDPTEGSIATTATLPICAPASATLTVSGQSNEVGEGLSWYSSTTSGGPYTLVPGAVTASLAVSGLTQTTYYVSRNTCLADAAFAESDEFAVTVNPQPVVLTATNDGPVCAGTAVDLAATSDIGTTFAWTGPGGFTSAQQDTSRIVELNQAGTYSVIASLNGCPSAPLTTTVVVDPSPAISSLTATPNPVCVGADAQLQVNATFTSTAQNLSNYAFSTSTGAALQDMTGATVATGAPGLPNDDTPSGVQAIGYPIVFNGVSYSDFVVSPDGWMRFGSTSGTNAFTNSVTSTTNIPRLFPYWDDLATGTNGSVRYLVTGTAPNRILVVDWFVTIPRNTSGAANSTFQAWIYENGDVEFRYGNMGPGGMSASVGLTGGTNNWQSVTVSDNTVSTTVANDLNAGQPENGRLYSFVAPAPVVLTYAWSPSTYLNNTTIANPLAQSVQGSETYVVTIGAPNGCSRVDTLDLVGGLPLVASISATDTTLCVGQSTILSAVVTGGGTPYTYLWSPGGASVAGITVSPTETTEYTVTVTDNCGINLEVDFTVNVNPLPTVAVSPTTALFCGTGSANLEASGAETYAWSPATGLSATTGAEVTATPAGTTTYTVTGTDANGCQNTATATITVAPEVSLSFAPELANICLGGSTNLVATAGPTSFNATANSGTISVAIPDGSLTGASSTLALAGGAGSIGANSTVSVTVNITHGWNEDLDIYLVGPGNCGTLELSTDNGGSDDNYTNTVFVTPSAFPSITDGVSPFTGSWTPEGTVNTAADLESGVDGGTYALPASVLAGCPVNGTWTLRVFDDESIFSGTLTNWAIDISGAGGSYTHEITGPGTIGTPVLSGDGNSIATASVSGLPQGENIFTVVSTSSTGCSATTTTTITVGEPLVVTIEPSANPICEGDQVTLTANASGGGEPFEYLWSPGGATTAAITVSPGTTTLYSVTVNDACTNEQSANVNVVVNDRPSATATASLACVGGTLQLTGTSDTGTSFAWTGPNGFESTDQNPSISNVATANAGTYTFTATLGDCSASGTVNVTVNPGASAVTVNPTTINSCFGNTVPLTASGGTGATAATATVSGTSPTTSSLGQSPFNRTDENRRTQYLVRALDLQNAGIVAGNLTSLAFNVTALGTTSGGFPNNMDGFTMKIGTTASTVVVGTAPLSSTFTTVFGPVSYSPSLGVNTLSFSTPFNWNGTSNILIDICYENDPGLGQCNASSPVCWGNSPTLSMATAAYTGTWSSSADNQPRCAYTGSGTTSTLRPIMTWGYTAVQQPVYTWSPATGLSATTGASVTATVGSSIVYTVTATLPSGCTNTGTSDIIVDPNATTVRLELRSDNGTQVSWEIVTLTDVVVCEGGGYPANADIITENCCLAEGCYRLRVMDSAGDGFGTTGGYQLRLLGSDPTDIRIIDNLGNFTNLTANGSLSAIGNGPSAFCFPFAADPKPVFQHRDKLDFVSGNYLISEEVAAVSAQWLVGNQTDDGYEFWIYDPNGTYAYRRFRNHATSDGFANVGATRACHMKINNWFASQAAPANVLLNVRIRPRVNGVNGPFGPAYRFKIDPARAACPLTKLNDTPGNQFESCDQTRTWGSGIIHARPVPGANRYQWRFRTVGEPSAPIIIRTTNTYFLQLNWPTSPLVAGKTYTVDVRASKTAGATWCTDAVLPALVDPWGDICSLTIAGSNAQGGGEQLVLEGNSADLAMYPNPNRGDQLWLSLDGIEEGVTQVSVDIYDMAGHRAVARMIPTQGTYLNTVMDLSGTDAGGSLAAGVYVVHIMAGDARYTERLVIQR